MNISKMVELDFLREIKSVTFSSVEEGLPKARIIDVMFIEDDKIFFTTARGKSFYRQLMNNPNVAVVGMDKNYKTIRIHGKVRKVEQNERAVVDKIFEMNPMMNDLYAGEKRDILDPFCIYEGVGEILDLGNLPLSRQRFSFGGAEVIEVGYKINENCIACGICKEACPEHCISEGDIYSINGAGCIECGRCYEKCPANAIDKLNKF